MGHGGFLIKLAGDGSIEDCDAMVGSFVGSFGGGGGFVCGDGSDGGDHFGDHGVDGVVVDV